MALVNFESVAAAAETITKDGGKPSVRAVMAALGGGSPNTILPLLSDWKAGRPALRASDIELDPRLAQVVAEMVQKASEQSARAAEERAADVQADAEAVAEAGRESEALASDLAAQLDVAQKLIVAKERALEDVQAAAGIQAKNEEEKATALQNQLAEERARADLAVQAVAKAEVRLELIPGLQSEVERLKPFEHQAAVLTAKLDAANAGIADMKQRLADALAATKVSQEEALKQAREAEKAMIAEQAAQARIESAVREMDTLKAVVADAKVETKTARTDTSEYKSEIKQLRADIAEMVKLAKDEKAKEEKA